MPEFFLSPITVSIITTATFHEGECSLTARVAGQRWTEEYWRQKHQRGLTPFFLTKMELALPEHQGIRCVGRAQGALLITFSETLRQCVELLILC